MNSLTTGPRIAHGASVVRAVVSLVILAGGVALAVWLWNAISAARPTPFDKCYQRWMAVAENEWGWGFGRADTFATAVKCADKRGAPSTR
jgi:hypothetical protein